jgi:hypothetical protein
MKQSLGFYRIEYLDSKVVQTKELISQEDYNRYKELNQLKSELHTKIKGGKKGKNNDPVLIQQLKDIENELKEYSNPYFVVGSPLHEAIETGILDVKASYSKPSPCKITKVENCESISSDEMDSDD